MRVAIVAESFLPNVNGVSNSVLRVLEHLRRTGHEALVIAPDTPRGESPADRLYDGIRVHRVPSKMFPKVTSLPLGVPRPRMVGVLRGFEPDVVHLASPALLGYGGLHAARYLRVPTVAVFQTDVAGFAESYGVGAMSRVAWAWTRHLHVTCRPDPGTVDVGDGKPGVASHPAGAPLGSRRRRHGVRPVGARRRTPRPMVARWQADRRLRRKAGPREARRAAGRACARDDLRVVVVGDGVDRAKLESLMPTAIFTGALYGEELAAAYASMDVFVHPGEHETFCQAVQEAMASGLPFIAPDAGGPRDLVTPMHTGLLLPVGEFETRLSQAVDHLIAERPRYSTAARRSVLSRTWPAVCEQLLGHYEAVQGEGPAPMRPA